MPTPKRKPRLLAVSAPSTLIPSKPRRSRCLELPKTRFFRLSTSSERHKGPIAALDAQIRIQVFHGVDAYLGRRRLVLREKLNVFEREILARCGRVALDYHGLGVC